MAEIAGEAVTPRNVEPPDSAPAAAPHGLAERLAAAEELNRQLRTALETRIVIEQAKGVLAERFRLPLDDAFELLRRSARSSRVRLHQLARRVVDDAETPPPIASVLRRRARPPGGPGPPSESDRGRPRP